MHAEQLEVLNISNVNAKGSIVLNDEKLLELVQLYPFLYNRRVRPFQDPDFEEWAWTNIATALNKTYGSLVFDHPFAIPVLKHRWQLLQPIILSLSKSYDIAAIPAALRQHVVKISVQLENQTTEVPQKPFTDAQNLILSNIKMVERLPNNLRKELEAEMMHLILKNEIVSKSTVKVSSLDTKKVEQECFKFLSEIGMKLSINQPQDKYKSGSNSNEASSKTFTPLNTPTSSRMKPLVYSLNKLHVPFPATDEMKNEIKEEPEDDFETKNQLLVPLERVTPHWVPLHSAALYTRRCVVRLKRVNMLPDDMPLARYKRELKW